MEVEFSSALWRYPGDGGWYFMTLPKDISEDIKIISSEKTKGFGSVRVAVSIGSSEWVTSIFPSKEYGSYILPVKKQIRNQEGIDDGSVCKVTLKLLDT